MPGSLSTQILPPADLHQAARDRQSQPVAFGAGALRRQTEIFFEDFLLKFGGDSRDLYQRQKCGSSWGQTAAALRRSTSGGRCDVRRSQKYGSTCSQTVPDDGVYFIALSRRLETTCCTL